MLLRAWNSFSYSHLRVKSCLCFSFHEGLRRTGWNSIIAVHDVGSRQKRFEVAADAVEGIVSGEILPQLALARSITIVLQDLAHGIPHMFRRRTRSLEVDARPVHVSRPATNTLFSASAPMFPPGASESSMSSHAPGSCCIALAMEPGTRIANAFETKRVYV